MNPDYIFVDGSAVLFRSYHAMPPLATSTGRPTGAIKGFINATTLLGKRFANSQVVMIFDSKGPSFRKHLYEQYKANRAVMPEELQQQIQPIFDYIEYSGYPLIKLQGYEADDIIARFSKQAKQHSKHALIVSNDKDLAQLVDDKVQMYDLTKDKIIDRNAVFAKYGVWPEQMGDFLTLTGDNSDNIPGVTGVGAKTAASWLQRYQSLKILIEQADEIKGKVGDNFRTAIEKIIPLSRQLVQLAFDCPLEQSIEQLKQKPTNPTALTRLAQEFEISIILQEITVTNSSQNNAVSQEQCDYDLITTSDALDDWVRTIRKEQYFAFDTETNGLDIISAKLVGFSLARHNGKSCYIPLAHDDDSEQLDQSTALKIMAPIFADQSILMVGQNLKFDLHILASYDVHPLCRIGDTMLQSYCLYSTARHDLNSLSKKLLSWQAIKYEDLVGKGKHQKTIDQIPVKQAAAYAAEDAWLAMRLHQKQETQLQSSNHSRVAAIYNNMEMPLVPVLLAMERNGTHIDTDLLYKQSRQYDKRLIELTNQCHQLIGFSFNLDSPKQLQSVLFEHMKIPSSKKTSTGQASTSEQVLSELANDYELVAKVLEYRTIKKLKSTYTDKLPKQVHPKTGRIHSSFHQAVTSTGRLSSANPNLQNIPIRTEEGRQIRKAFIAESGNILISADYSQIELRIMAHLSTDDGLLDAFAKGEDIHQATAAEIFAISPEQVTDQHRRDAKAINFGLIYGMSAFGLAKQLSISRNSAKSYMDTYFNRYPGVLDYMERIKEQAKLQGYVETINGRRLHINNINSANPMQKMAAQRTAINAPMQGTAADIIKQAMIDLYQLWQNDKEIKMIIQVHDELIFEVPKSRAEQCRQQIIETMSQAITLDVPLIVKADMAANWLDAH